jgi:hypothetical protein
MEEFTFIYVKYNYTTHICINIDTNQLNMLTSDIFHAIPENSWQHFRTIGLVTNISNIYTIRF